MTLYELICRHAKDENFSVAAVDAAREELTQYDWQRPYYELPAFIPALALSAARRHSKVQESRKYRVNGSDKMGSYTLPDIVAFSINGACEAAGRMLFQTVCRNEAELTAAASARNETISIRELS